MKNKIEKKGVVVSFIIAAVVIGIFVFIIINNKKEEQNLPEEITSVDENVAPNSVSVIVNEAEPTKNTMEKISKNGDVLVMNYTGRFVDGKTFDSNIDPAFGHVQPFKFTLGKGMVIQGWDEGLLGMKTGEKKTLTVPPEKGYGPNDYSSIPGNSTLVFEVELVGIE